MMVLSISYPVGEGVEDLMVTGGRTERSNSYLSHKSLSEKKSAQGRCANNKVAYEGQETTKCQRHFGGFFGEIREN